METKKSNSKISEIIYNGTEFSMSVLMLGHDVRSLLQDKNPNVIVLGSANRYVISPLNASGEVLVINKVVSVTDFVDFYDNTTSWIEVIVNVDIVDDYLKDKKVGNIVAYNKAKYSIVGNLKGIPSYEKNSNVEIFPSNSGRTEYDVENDHKYKPLPDNVTIGFSSVHGLGVIATKDIKLGVDVGMTHIENTYDKLKLPNNLIRLPLGGFLNHSKLPNCQLVRENDFYYLIPLKDIKVGEELLIDYTQCPFG